MNFDEYGGLFIPRALNFAGYVGMFHSLFFPFICLLRSGINKKAKWFLALGHLLHVGLLPLSLEIPLQAVLRVWFRTSHSESTRGQFTPFSFLFVVWRGTCCCCCANVLCGV